MRSPPSKSATTTTKRRSRDAESELNLPPGFRFNPTDEELIVHYLCRKSAPPLSIIADVDLYKHEPWELPEMAWFGTKEWYFFTPRDKKYPNGSRPNRVTGNGYWKATGADKPIKSKADPNTTVGIKKALVFYSGKGSKGIKTNWIMHEYRLPVPNVSPSKTTTVSKLNDWVLCRLYNKKNNPKEMVIQENDDIHPKSLLGGIQRGDDSYSNNSSSLNSFEYSDGEFVENDSSSLSAKSEEDSNMRVAGISLLRSEDVDNENNWLKLEDFQHYGWESECLAKSSEQIISCSMGLAETSMHKNDEDQDFGNEWLDSFSLQDLDRFMEAMPPDHDICYEIPMMDYYSSQQQFSF